MKTLKGKCIQQMTEFAFGQLSAEEYHAGIAKYPQVLSIINKF